jgi:ribosome-binding protein aMBF1 (putative translation factor)
MKSLIGSARRKFRLGVRQYRAVLDFVTAVEEEMERSQMRPTDLARKLKKSRSWVSKIFRTKPNLTFFTAVELADALGKDLYTELRDRVAKGQVVPLRPPVALNDASRPSLRVVGSPAEVVPNPAPVTLTQAAQ